MQRWCDSRIQMSKRNLQTEHNVQARLPAKHDHIEIETCVYAFTKILGVTKETFMD